MTFALADRVYIATVPRPQGARWLPSLLLVGAWRSLVAHLPGGQGVAGSNPVAPTILSLPEHRACWEPAFGPCDPMRRMRYRPA